MLQGIHKEILTYVEGALEDALLSDISWVDPNNQPQAGDTRAGLVQVGPLQDDPAVDEARIVVTLHENDPHEFHAEALTGITTGWNDEVYDVEVGNITTWRRRFTIRGRVLLENTGETVDQARQIVSTLRHRIERCLLGLTFTGVSVDGEYVSMPVLPKSMAGEIYQSGGPGAYDFHVKVRFEVLTTITGV